MGTRDDANLSARERAAIAALEATAAAEDPQLAIRLRGSKRLRSIPRPPGIPAWVHHESVGVPVLLVGLAMIVMGLATTLVVGILGAFVGVAGTWIVVESLERRLREARGQS